MSLTITIYEKIRQPEISKLEAQRQRNRHPTHPLLQCFAWQLPPLLHPKASQVQLSKPAVMGAREKKRDEGKKEAVLCSEESCKTLPSCVPSFLAAKTVSCPTNSGSSLCCCQGISGPNIFLNTQEPVAKQQISSSTKQETRQAMGRADSYRTSN